MEVGKKSNDQTKNHQNQRRDWMTKYCPYCEEKDKKVELIEIDWLSRCQRCDRKVDEQEVL
jgi:hypothetical protein